MNADGSIGGNPFPSWRLQSDPCPSRFLIAPLPTQSIMRRRGKMLSTRFDCDTRYGCWCRLVEAGGYFHQLSVLKRWHGVGWYQAPRFHYVDVVMARIIEMKRLWRWYTIYIFVTWTCYTLVIFKHMNESITLISFCFIFSPIPYILRIRWFTIPVVIMIAFIFVFLSEQFSRTWDVSDTRDLFCNLRKLLFQYEILFCVQDEIDPVIMVVQSLLDKYPKTDAKLLIGMYDGVDVGRCVLQSQDICIFFSMDTTIGLITNKC